MSFPPFRSLRSTLAVVVITLSTAALSLGCADDARVSSEVMVVRIDDYPVIEPPRFADSLDRIARELAAVRVDLPTRVRFPRSLTTLPVVPGLPGGLVDPARPVVAPGQASCERQAVPSRSRRKLRTWERDTAA